MISVKNCKLAINMTHLISLLIAKKIVVLKWCTSSNLIWQLPIFH